MVLDIMSSELVKRGFCGSPKRVSNLISEGWIICSVYKLGVVKFQTESIFIDVFVHFIESSTLIFERI